MTDTALTPAPLDSPKTRIKKIHIETDTGDGSVMCGRSPDSWHVTNGSGDGLPGDLDMSLDDLDHPALCRTCVRALYAEGR